LTMCPGPTSRVFGLRRYLLEYVKYLCRFAV
jgi:hypothetical protein